MKRQFWMIFLFITGSFSTFCQIEDDFSSENRELDTSWRGDRRDFIINSSEQLQLSAGEAGSSILYKENIWQPNQSWEMDLTLDFNPSANNRLDIYLWADSPDLISGSGLLLRIGENGSEDALILINKTNGNLVEIARGTMGLVALEPVDIQLHIYRNNGNLVVAAASKSDGCLESQIESPTALLLPGEPFFFGFKCHYTSTRTDKFSFDNIYVGTLKIDTTPPSIITSEINETTISIYLSEPANILFPPFISLAPDPGDLNLEFQKNRLSITSVTGFETGITHNLTLMGLEDLAGNVLDTVLELIIAASPGPGALLINEVLFNPQGSGSDFIEIVNVSGSLLNINGLYIRNEKNGEEIELSGLPKLDTNQLLVLATDPENIIQQFPQNRPDRIYSINIPRMANDEGNIRLMYNDFIVDGYDYSENHHHPLLDDVDGVSLERISIDIATNEPSNWSSALEEFGFGTPGLANSVLHTGRFEQPHIALSYTIFSPNNDGYRDQLPITYSFNRSDFVGDISIYNDRGYWITDIRKNDRIGATGTIIWDGTTNNGDFAPIGIYIISIRLFSPDGERVNQKLTCGLGDFLD